MAPKDIHNRISGNWCMSFYMTKGALHVRLRILRKIIFFFALSGWIQYNNKCPYKWETIVSESEEGLKTEVGIRVRENLMLPLKVEEETKSQEPGGF